VQELLFDLIGLMSLFLTKGKIHWPSAPISQLGIKAVLEHFWRHT